MAGGQEMGCHQWRKEGQCDRKNCKWSAYHTKEMGGTWVENAYDFADYSTDDGNITMLQKKLSWRARRPIENRKEFDLASIRLATHLGVPIDIEKLRQTREFSHADLIRAISQPLKTYEIAEYLSRWPEAVVREGINQKYHDFPPLFFAIQRMDCELVRLLIETGASPDISGRHSIPLLAWTILEDDPRSSKMVATLLSLGCDPATIPSDMYGVITEAPNDGVSEEVLQKTPWCSPGLRVCLTRSLNISQRYLLQKASKCKPVAARKKQAAKLLKISGLLGLPYFVVGQEIASNLVCSSVMAHLTIKSSHPLVMAFVGPAGHGKTEVAKQMGALISTNILVVDCTEMRHETDLFGPKHPYQGCEAGAALNNHLAREDKKRSVVFLDEFDKTTEEVRQSLLTIFDDGKYRDRRCSSQEYDCSQIIWILATNVGSKSIHTYCGSSPYRSKAPSPTDMEKLSSDIRRTFLGYFQGPLTGRITLIVPFLTFTKDEQAVMTHQLILRLATELRPPICLREDRLIGHIDLKVGVHSADGDGPVCALLAEQGYHPELGARSLYDIVEKRVRMPLADIFLENEEEIDDVVMNKGPRMGYSINHQATGNQDQRVIVIRPLDTVKDESQPGMSQPSASRHHKNSPLGFANTLGRC